MAQSEIIELTIDRLSFNGGRGVGRYLGVVVFIPDTAPGDTVRAKVTLKKSNLWEAELVEIVTPSDARRSPPCPVAELCGGCSWQHIAYAEQLRQKQGIVAFALKKFMVNELREIIPAPNEWRYRNRIQVHVQSNLLGFFAKRSQTIVPIDDCLIADERLTEKFDRLRKNSTKLIQRTELSLDDGGMFSQVNVAQNRNLIKEVLGFFVGSLRSPGSILDLYAGSGNLTGPLAECFPEAKVTAVELSRPAVERGKKSLPKVSWENKDVEKFLMENRSQTWDAIVLDPPRVGCANGVVDMLCEIPCAQLVYVSCNPMTFARDAAKLLEKGRFTLDSVQPLDMFPQTEHIELVAKFSRL